LFLLTKYFVTAELVEEFQERFTLLLAATALKLLGAAGALERWHDLSNCIHPASAQLAESADTAESPEDLNELVQPTNVAKNETPNTNFKPFMFPPNSPRFGIAKLRPARQRPRVSRSSKKVKFVYSAKKKFAQF